MKKGYKPISVSNAAYEQLVATVEQAKLQTAQKPKQQSGGGCSMVVVVGLPGPTVDRSCSGGCGFIVRFLGRSCQMVGSTTPGGLEIYCMCGGGWWNSLWR